MPTRRAGSHDPVRVGPLDPDGVMAVDLDLTEWLDGQTVVGQSFTSPTEVGVGDGVIVVTTPSGAVTPPAPSVTAGVLTFHVFQATGQTLVIGQDYQVTAHYRTATRADDCTVVFAARER